MKKLIALLAVAGMMFSSFVAYAGTLTEEEFIANHKQQITDIGTSVKNIVEIYKTTARYKKIVKCAEEETAPLTLPDLTEEEKAQLKQANQAFEKSMEAAFGSLTDEEAELLIEIIERMYGTMTMDFVRMLPDEAQQAFFSGAIIECLPKLLTSISEEEWSFFYSAEEAIPEEE